MTQTTTIPDNLTTQKLISDWFYILVGMRPNSQDISNLLINLNSKCQILAEAKQKEEQQTVKKCPSCGENIVF